MLKHAALAAGGALVLLVGGVVAAQAAGTSTPVTCSSDGTTLSCPLPTPMTVTETATETGPGSTVTVLGPTTTATATVTVTQSPDPTTSVAPTSTTGAPTTATAASTTATTPAAPAAFPGPSNTGTPAGVTLHNCSATLTAGATYDACHFTADIAVHANNVTITRSLINGSVDAEYGTTGLTISDTTIDCGCPSTTDTSTPTAVLGSGFTLLRDNIFDSGHGVAPDDNYTIQDSWIHGLGGNTNAHKDGLYIGDGTNGTIRHNTIECNDGPKDGCTSAIGLLTDFTNITHLTIDDNLLNTIGPFCFYGAGGPQKRYVSQYITFTNNHFGRAYHQQCGVYGPVTYWDASQPGMVWSGNVWDDTGATVPPAN